MDKCDNISSLSFSNFPLKTSFAIKSFQKSLETHLRIITPLTSSIGTIIHGDRLEICRDRRDRRSCKIFPSCVNFSRKQRGSLSNLHRNMKFTQLFGNFTHISFKTIEIIHIHFNFNKRDHQCSHKRCFIVAKKVALYALLVCKIFGPKIRSCKIFDKFQVWSLAIFDYHTNSLEVRSCVVPQTCDKQSF